MKKHVIRILVGLLALVIVIPLGGYFYVFRQPHPGDPKHAEISFTALQQFAELYANAEGNTLNYEAYFESAGKPVEVWKKSFDVDAGRLEEHASENPRLYEDLQKRFTSVAQTEASIRQSYAELERLYPESVFSPLHVFFGGYSIRSLIKPYGILFAGEYFSGMPVAMNPDDPNYMRGLVSAPAKIVTQTIHEQAHIQQARNSPLAMFTSTVLERALYEGTADLVAELITGDHNNETAMAWVVGHGDALWCSFYHSLDRSYRDRWIDVGQFGPPPASIFGAFGLPLARAYFETFEDSSQGLQALLELNDSYEEIFERSGMQKNLQRRCKGIMRSE